MSPEETEGGSEQNMLPLDPPPHADESPHEVEPEEDEPNDIERTEQVSTYVPPADVPIPDEPPPDEEPPPEETSDAVVEEPKPEPPPTLGGLPPTAADLARSGGAPDAPKPEEPKPDAPEPAALSNRVDTGRARPASIRDGLLTVEEHL